MSGCCSSMAEAWPMRRRRILPFVACGLVLPALLAAASGQLETFDERSRVVEVEVPVNVSGPDGEPIRDLSIGDFTIFDEGRPQQIDDLEVIDLRASGVRDGGEAAVVPAVARRHFLFLFDLSFSSPSAIFEARLAARRFALEALHPSDLAAVAVHGVDQPPHLLITFTTDRAQVLRAIDTLGVPRLLSLETRDPLRFFIDRPDLAAGGLGGIAGSGGETSGARFGGSVGRGLLQDLEGMMASAERSRTQARVSAWSRSMAEMARLLGSLPGRKHVLYFSQGFDGRLLFGRGLDPFDPEAQAENRDLEEGRFFSVDSDARFGSTALLGEVRRMLEDFRRADCVVQALDISGLRADSRGDLRSQRAGREALQHLAAETGGGLFLGNDIGEQLAHALERSEVTYLLRFRPDRLGSPGEYRSLRVELGPKKRATVSHRAGYVVPLPFAELHPLEKDLLAADLIAAASERAEIRVRLLAAPFPGKGGRAYVPVIVEVGGAELLAADTGGDRVAPDRVAPDRVAPDRVTPDRVTPDRVMPDRVTLEFYVYVTTRAGAMQDFFSQRVTIDLASRRRQFRETGVRYYGHVDLPSGDYQVRALVRDGSNGASGLETAPLVVPSFGAGEPYLLPPLFPDEPGLWLLVREEGEDGGRERRVYPYTMGGEPFVPSVLPQLPAGSAVDLLLVGFNMQLSEVEAEARLLPSDGGVARELRLELEGLAGWRRAGEERKVGRISTGDAEPGLYVLQLSVIDPQSGRRLESSLPVRVMPR